MPFNSSLCLNKLFDPRVDVLCPVCAGDDCYIRLLDRIPMREQHVFVGCNENEFMLRAESNDTRVWYSLLFAALLVTEVMNKTLHLKPRVS